MTPLKNIIFIFGNILFALIIIITGIAFLLKPDIFNPFDLEGYSNDFCQSLNKTNYNTLDFLICDNKYKKSKIIYLLIDSLAYDQIYDFNNLSKYNLTNFFKAGGIDYKQTGSLFESIFTGKFSRNYMADRIKIDNLALQFKKAKMQMFYKVRSNFPLGSLIDKDYIDEFEIFTKNFICKINFRPIARFKREYIDNLLRDEITLKFRKGYNVSHLYEFANQKLNEVFENMSISYNKCLVENSFSSIVFFTETMDHLNHVYHKYYPLNRYLVYYIEKLVEQLIKWINEYHSEYALVLASDHGGQYYFGEDTLCNHGCNLPGNEGIFFVYTKELGKNYNKLKLINDKEDIPIISINDYSCTIAQILKNVNLPLESTCTPRIVGNDKLLKFTSSKSKEIQLKKYIEYLYIKYPKINNKFKETYYNQLEKNKYTSFFKNKDSIYKATDEFYEEYMKYLINIQTDLNEDLKKYGQNTKYYLILFSILLFLIIKFYYTLKEFYLISKKKFDKLLENENKTQKKIIIKNTLIYMYILLPILFIDVLMLLININSLTISEIINISVFVKLIFILLFLFIIYYLNRKNNKINKLLKIIILLFIIIVIHYIMHKIQFFSYFDRIVNTQKKANIFKYTSYFLILIYSSFEINSNWNYYISKKKNIRYTYIIIPYIIITSLFCIKYDLYLSIHPPRNPPHIISLLKIIYSLILILPLFIKPLVIVSNNELTVSKIIINLKLFLLVLILFICTEVERVEIILLYCPILYYLSNCFLKEEELLFKIIYLVIMNIYPHLHFIGNQGTYTLDTSIKITPKCPAAYADNSPIIMGLLFVIHKFKFYFIYIGYIYSITKLSKNNVMSYYTRIIRILHNSQLISITICFFIYLKNEKEKYFIHILFLIGTKGLIVIFYDIVFLLNYLAYMCLNNYYITKNKVISIKAQEEENYILKMI